MRAWFQCMILYGFFHGDVHAGNLMVLDDGRLGFLDFGIIGRFDDQQRLLVTDYIFAFSTGNYRGLGEVMLGSVAEAVLRRSVAPIVLVGPQFEPDWHLSESPTVLAGYDGSASARDVAFVAGRLSADLDGRVRLEEVLRPTDVVQSTRFPAGHVEAIEDLATALHERGITAQYEITDGFDPADVLVADAVRAHCDLLALGSHGRSGLQRVALGSVTMRAVHRAPCPVLVTGPAVRVPG